VSCTKMSGDDDDHARRRVDSRAAFIEGCVIFKTGVFMHNNRQADRRN